jgi:hypothetical protein
MPDDIVPEDGARDYSVLDDGMLMAACYRWVPQSA